MTNVKNIEILNDECSHYRLHSLLVTCNYCQKDFKTFNSRQVRCSSCCQSIERKLKTYTFEKFKKLSNVYNIKKENKSI